jgi:hypothetical protein
MILPRSSTASRLPKAKVALGVATSCSASVWPIGCVGQAFPRGQESMLTYTRFLPYLPQSLIKAKICGRGGSPILRCTGSGTAQLFPGSAVLDKSEEALAKGVTNYKRYGSDLENAREKPEKVTPCVLTARRRCEGKGGRSLQTARSRSKAVEAGSERQSPPSFDIRPVARYVRSKM